MRFISHELRTPLNSVFMGLQLSIDQIPEDTQEPAEVERKETLVETQSACGAALDILNELLLFDKLESGALVLNKLNVPVPELVEDSIKIFSVQTREKSIELVITNNDESMLSTFSNAESSRDGEPPPQGASLHIYDTDEVTVDKNKVVQVIRNVVSNAIKFTPARGRIQINIKFVPDAQKKERSGKAQVSSELIIEVKDNGAGISEVNQRRLFKEVVQFNPELLQNGGGSGLGMCISKSIMDMHGGIISVYSAGEGQGSLFTLRLPMVRVVSDAKSPPIYNPTQAARLRRLSIRLPKKAQEAPVSIGTDPPETSAGIHGAITSELSATARSEILSPLTSARVHCNPVPDRVLRFLVVDDSKTNRKMLCRLLQKQGHECVEAEDGVQAVAVMTAALAARQELVGDEKIERARKPEGSTDEGGRAEEGVGNTEFDMILMDFM